MLKLDDWTEILPEAPWIARSVHRCVSDGQYIYMCGGYNTETGARFKDVWRSPDGINWTLLTDDAEFGERSAHGFIYFNEKLWVVGGYKTTGGFSDDVWSSDDGGYTWDLVTISGSGGFGGRHEFALVEFDNKLWVIGGFDGSDRKNDAWYSPDGFHWFETTTMVIVPYSYGVREHVAVNFLNKIWVLGGDSGAFRQDIFSSTDGAVWSNNGTADWPGRRELQAVVNIYDSEIAIVGGYDSRTPYLNDVWRSNNGILWYQVTQLNPFTPRSDFGFVTHNNNSYIIGGINDEGSLGDVWASVAIIPPSPSSSSSSSSPLSIAAKVIQVLGDNSTVIVSNNAVEGFTLDEDFVFSYKFPDTFNSQLKVINNIVSRMELQENADVISGNIQTNLPVLVRSQGSIEEGDYNINGEEGQRAIGITPSISGMVVYDADLPRLLEEDLYRHKRSQLLENGDDSADAGAIEVEFLDDSKTFQDSADDNLALITPQGRNLLARSTLGQAACKIKGFAIGRGGYEYHNPVKVLPIDTVSDNARGWIIFKTNTWVSTDIIKFQGRLPYQTSFKAAILGTEIDDLVNHIYYFAIGTDLEATIDNAVEKINASTELLDTIYVERENDTLHIISVPTGTIGNTIWYSAVGEPFETPHANPLLGGSLIGGVDELISGVVIDPIYEGTVDGEQCILEYANRSALAVTVKIHPNLGIRSAVGEFILKAEITKSVFPGEVGTIFAFAVGHHPINCIHSKSLWVKRFVIQL